MITGGSAGGYTTLCGYAHKTRNCSGEGELLRRQRRGGSCARHAQIRARYLDWLIRPYPRAGTDLCAHAPPSKHVSEPSRLAVIFFQGARTGRPPKPDRTDGRGG